MDVLINSKYSDHQGWEGCCENAMTCTTIKMIMGATSGEMAKVVINFVINVHGFFLRVIEKNGLYYYDYYNNSLNVT